MSQDKTKAAHSHRRYDATGVRQHFFWYVRSDITGHTGGRKRRSLPKQVERYGRCRTFHGITGHGSTLVPVWATVRRRGHAPRRARAGTRRRPHGARRRLPCTAQHGELTTRPIGARPPRHPPRARKRPAALNTVTASATPAPPVQPGPAPPAE